MAALTRCCGFNVSTTWYNNELEHIFLHLLCCVRFVSALSMYCSRTIRSRSRERKGGFAHCYKVTCVDTGRPYAMKIVPKSTLIKSRARQKV